jgi:hypothetical protein
MLEHSNQFKLKFQQILLKTTNIASPGAISQASGPESTTDGVTVDRAIE